LAMRTSEEELLGIRSPDRKVYGAESNQCSAVEQ